MPVRVLPMALLPALALLLSACQTAPPAPPVPPTTVPAVGEVRPGSGVAKGYLDRKQLPDSVALLVSDSVSLADTRQPSMVVGPARPLLCCSVWLQLVPSTVVSRQRQRRPAFTVDRSKLLPMAAALYFVWLWLASVSVLSRSVSW